MSRAPSEATQLKTAKRELKETKEALGRMQEMANAYRARASKAEQEVAEWKARFDLLLKRDGVPPCGAST